MDAEMNQVRGRQPLAEIYAEARKQNGAEQAIPNQLKNLNLIFAGHAYFTIRNSQTGNRFTFRVSKSKSTPQFPNVIHFCSVLTGPDNTSCYTYMGFVKDPAMPGTSYRHGKKIDAMAQSVQAFKWLMTRIEKRVALPASVEIWHEGRCCRCGRLLTVPESIEAGLGPECAGRIQ